MFCNLLARTASLAIAATLLASALPVHADRKKDAARPDVILPQLAAFAQGSAVHAYYKIYRGPEWFKDGGEAAAQLAKLLRRAPLDGLPQGPALADQVERAAQSVGTKDKSQLQTSEQVLSAIWVTYVEAIQRPTSDVIYGYPTLVPRPQAPERVLAAAAGAPSLTQHLGTVSGVNPLYSQLRDAAWTQMGTNPAAPPNSRIVKNLERLRSLPRTERFALVNIVDQTLTMYEKGQPVDSMKVIVGTTELPTPMIKSVIYYATLNPYWNVPEHLVRKTVAPNVLKSGVAYLKTRGYQVMSDWSAAPTELPPTSIDWAAVAAGKKKVRIRQLPNGGNSMGKMKFPFENGEGIFLHDTPTREHFAKSVRAISNGCVRLEDARRFGKWLLKRDPVIASGAPEQVVALPTGVPVYITYLTAQERSGQISFLNDIYGWDAGGRFQPLGVSAGLVR